jgi:hypothetical protein
MINFDIKIVDHRLKKRHSPRGVMKSCLITSCYSAYYDISFSMCHFSCPVFIGSYDFEGIDGDTLMKAWVWI